MQLTRFTHFVETRFFEVSLSAFLARLPLGWFILDAELTALNPIGSPKAILHNAHINCSTIDYFSRRKQTQNY